MIDRDVSERLLLFGEWTNDCQGKQDYDPDMVSISTRFWPRGGGFHLLNTSTGEFLGNESRPEIRPSAHSSLVIRYARGKREGAYADSLDLAEARFEADTEGEVKAQVEAWAQQQMDRVVALLRKEFDKSQ